MQLMMRSDIPIATLRFWTYAPPNQAIEVARLNTTMQHVRNIVEVLGKNLEEYEAQIDKARDKE